MTAERKMALQPAQALCFNHGGSNGTRGGGRPYDKQLSARRLGFIGDIRASLVRFNGNSRDLFRDILVKRNASRLQEHEAWFRCVLHERLFSTFVEKNIVTAR
jgi:hypothetical protein